MVECINSAVSSGENAHAFLYDGVARERHYFAIGGELIVLVGYVDETVNYGMESVCETLAISSDGTCPEIEGTSCAPRRDYR